MTRTTVIVPVYRGWTHVQRLLDDLRADDLSGLEVVVVDDASNDGGADELMASDPGVRVIVRETNGGFAAAVNTGLAIAHGATVAVLNSDLRLSVRDLWVLVEYVEGDPQALVGPLTRSPTGEALPSAHRPRTVGRLVADFCLPIVRSRRLSSRIRDWDHDAERSALPVETGWITGSCLVFDSAMARDVGPLDERFVMDSDEVDWQTRWRHAGGRIVLHPGVVVEHDVGHGHRDSPDEHAAHTIRGWRGRTYYVRKHLPSRLLLFRILMAAAFVASFPVWLVDALRKGPRQPVRECRLHARVLTVSWT